MAKKSEASTPVKINTKVRVKGAQSPVSKALNPPNSDGEYPQLKISSSQVFPVREPTGKTVAFARCTLCEQIQLTGLRIVDGVNGLFVSYPNDPLYKGDDYRAIFYPITKELRTHIEDTLIAQYNEMIKQQEE
jgi:stage V sporulation protein G